MKKSIDHAYLLSGKETYTELVILETGSITTPEGKRVVMTENGVVTPAVPGRYQGGDLPVSGG